MIYNAWLNRTYCHKIYCYGLHTTIINHVTFYITPATKSRYIGMYWFILLWGNSKDNKNSMVSYSRLLLENAKVYFNNSRGNQIMPCLQNLHMLTLWIDGWDDIHTFYIEKIYLSLITTELCSTKPNDFSWPIHNTIVHNVYFVICCSHHVIFSIIQPSMKSYWNIYCTPYYIQWNPSGKARNVSLKLQNLVHFHAPFFTNHVYFTPHDRPPLLKGHHLGWPL